MFTSRDALDSSNSGAATSDLGKMDAVSIPLALLVLAWRVRSLPLMTVPLLTLPLTILVAFSIVYKLAEHTNYPTFSPSLFVSTAVAMSFDWALFLLTRYKEGVARGADNETCVKDTLHFAGHTVVLSGITLCVAYGALVAFPATYIQTVGVGAAVTLGTCMAVNLTLVPSLLLVAPRFFRLRMSRPCCVACCTCRCCRSARRDAAPAAGTPLLRDSTGAGVGTDKGSASASTARDFVAAERTSGVRFSSDAAIAEATAKLQKEQNDSISCVHSAWVCCTVLCRGLHVASCVLAQLSHRDSRVEATVVVHCCHPRSWFSTFVRLVQGAVSRRPWQDSASLR